VLVAGGTNNVSGTLTGVELYDPLTGKWTTTGALSTRRVSHRATLLPNGKVLVVGGRNDGSILSSAEVYDVGLGFSSAWQPRITAVTSPLDFGGSLAITGSQFRGISGGSSGHGQDSPGDYPVAQLRSLENEHTVFLLCTNWSTNLFASTPVTGFPAGYAMATVFVNGIQSTGSVLIVKGPIAIPTIVTDVKRLGDGSFQFAFSNSVGALLGVLATTNPALPLNNWTTLGGVSEISPGQFQFTDPQATNSPQRFYRVRSL
jgi:hypothetical protein